MLCVTLPPEIQARLVTALTKSGPLECGGVLLGEHVGENLFAVRDFTVQKPGTFASFVRSLFASVVAIKKYLKTRGNDYGRFNYLGEWHSHPSFSTQPSGTDHQSMREIVSDQAVGANFVVLLIFRLSSPGRLEGSAHTYLPDGSVFQSQLVLEAA
jgi:integrative and conjugative element protein (TIGR02256 family)